MKRLRINNIPVFIFVLFITMQACVPVPKFTSANSIGAKKDNGQGTTPESMEDFKNQPDVIKTYKGTASYYADKFHGNITANGEVYDMHGLTAAHPTFPFGTKLRVVNLDNGRSVEVEINDRMPYNPNRIIDLSVGAAKKLGMIEAGLAEVRLEILKWGK